MANDNFLEVPNDLEEVLEWMGRHNERRQIDLPGVRDRLDELATELSDVLNTIKNLPDIRPEHGIADQVVRSLCWHAYSSAKAVFILVLQGTPRVSYGCARTSLEATQDLVFLATTARYDFYGARACAATILDRDQEYELLAKDFSDVERLEFESVRQSVQEELSLWERVWVEGAPNNAGIFREAVAAVKRDISSGKSHWSGVAGGRRGIIKWIRQQPEWAYHFLCSEGVYKQLARWSHARPEIGIGWRGFGPYLPIAVARGSAFVTSLALRRIFGLADIAKAKQ